MNKTTITGRLTKDAEQKLGVGEKGTNLLGFSVAVTTGAGGDFEKTSFFECTLFGKRAEGKLIDYLKKGQLVALDGEVSAEAYLKNDGTPAASLKLTVAEIELMGSNK